MKPKRIRNNSSGCLMAVVNHEDQQHVLKFARRMIPQKSLYEEVGDESYGFDDCPHVTIKFGFNPDLTHQQLNEVLRGMKKFDVTVRKMNQFTTNEDYDVVKFEIEKSPELMKLRELCDKFPNDDKFPNYNPHMTLGYVKKGSFQFERNDIDLKLPVTQFKYSAMDDSYSYKELQ
jgi:hypothetical protein